jgi:hypothetical protein
VRPSKRRCRQFDRLQQQLQQQQQQHQQQELAAAAAGAVAAEAPAGAQSHRNSSCRQSQRVQRVHSRYWTMEPKLGIGSVQPCH